MELPAVRWNLSALADSMEDTRLDGYWTSVEEQAERFEAAYRGKVSELDGPALAKALTELEALSTTIAKPMSYASLLFATDSGDPKVGAFLQKGQERGTAVSVKLMFFELELQAIPEARMAELRTAPELIRFGHFLDVTRVYSPYRLSEKEEIILEETANTGSRAWVRLFEELTGNHIFRIYLPGKDAIEEMSESEVLALLKDADRKTREAAGKSLTEGLKELERVLVYNYNNLIQDKAVEDRLRGYEYPEQSRHLSNELDKPTVDLVMSLCKEYEGLVARYYRVKREIMELPKLDHLDRYAPLFPTEEKVSWDRAQEIVLEAFGGFSPVLKERAGEFFAKNWIDAEPRLGKRGGAFCAYNTPDTHPVVLQSYQNRLDDVMTLAHELGHGVHASLSRKQGYFDFHGTLPLAELASTFGEMLVFESLVKDAAPKDRLALYADKIEGVFATVFRQAAMFRFETRCHAKRREDGELTPEEFGDLWQEEIQGMFGDSVEIGEEHRMWWSYVGHFIFAPFYVYAYSFGELLVLSLYGRAKKEGPAFADKYVALLELGGSRSPRELMATVGVDLGDESFWREGFAALESLVSDFEAQWSAMPNG